MTEPADTASRTIEDYLGAAELPWELGARDGEYVVTLPGEKKLRTVVSLRVGERDLRAEAFVIRHPDENQDRFHAYLLRANLRLRGLAYGIDSMGDVYVTGRVPLAALDEDRLDRLLGAVLEAADDPFNELLVIGFRTSMQKEWDWRISRGESTRNLEAFRHLLERPAPPADTGH